MTKLRVREARPGVFVIENAYDDYEYFPGRPLHPKKPDPGCFVSLDEQRAKNVLARLPESGGWK